MRKDCVLIQSSAICSVWTCSLYGLGRNHTVALLVIHNGGIVVGILAAAALILRRPAACKGMCQSRVFKDVFRMSLPPGQWGFLLPTEWRLCPRTIVAVVCQKVM